MTVTWQVWFPPLFGSFFFNPPLSVKGHFCFPGPICQNPLLWFFLFIVFWSSDLRGIRELTLDWCWGAGIPCMGESALTWGRGDFILINFDEISLNFSSLEFRSPNLFRKFSSKIWAKFSGIVSSSSFPLALKFELHQSFHHPVPLAWLDKLGRGEGFDWQRYEVLYLVLNVAVSSPWDTPIWQHSLYSMLAWSYKFIVAWNLQLWFL